MKTLFKIPKILIASLTALALAAPLAVVNAEPVQMTLTYDGTTHQYSAESIELRVNGTPVELAEMPPIILEGRTFVPSREVFEPLGAAVDWKATSKEVYIGYNGTLVVLKPDAETADVNGVFVPLDSPAKIINDKLMIPARFVAEQLGIAVNWDPANRIVSIGHEPEPQEVAEPTTPPEQYAPTESPAPAPPDASTTGIPVDISAQPLTQISGSPVNVTGVNIENNVFTVTASNAISRVEKVILPENKLVLDIYNATNALGASSYPSTGFSGVSAVRNSQFQTAPEMITRIVFDLVGSNRFSVAFSGDRKSVVVTFEENTVNDVVSGVSGDAETITIMCKNPPTIAASKVFDPNRLVFDVPGAKYNAPISELNVGGRFIGKIHASQFESGVARIVVDLNADAQYKISQEGNNAVITLTAPTYRNISYAQQPSPAITLTGFEGLSAAQLEHRDEYLNGRYVLTMPADYSGQLGYGVFEINDSVLKNVTIQNNNGKTELVFNQQGITSYVVENWDKALIIRPVNPKEIYKTIVYVDAGHGLNDPGAQAGGFQEKNLNLNIAMRLYEHLERDPEIKVYMSRMDDTYPENIARAHTANKIADLFLSVHHNASESSSSNGTEVLYLNHEGEAYPNISSEGVARIIQTNLVRDMDTTDRGVVKRTNLIVLNQTTIPAVIVEICFMTNPNDLAKVSIPEGRQKAADSLYASVKEIFRQYPTNR